jgi:hypothetical protein
MKAKNLTTLLLASLALAGAQAAFAKPHNYTYAGIQFFDQDLDNYNCDQNGLNLYGSLELNQNFFARASFADANGNRGCGSQNLTLGGGYQTAFGSQSSIYGVVSFEDISPDHGDGDSGLILAAGIRTYLMSDLEGKVEVAHHTAFDGDNEIIGGVVYWFDTSLSVTGDVSLGSDQTTLAVGVRMSF